MPPVSIENRRAHAVNNYYSPSRQSEFRSHQPRRLRSRRRRTNYKALAVLALTLVLSLLLVAKLLLFVHQFALQEKLAVLPSQALVYPPVTTPPVTPEKAIAYAIAGQESSVNFQALNPHSGALGLAQIMPANLNEWSQDILGYPLTPDEFLSSPELQLEIIHHKLREYWQEALVDTNGDEESAVLRVASYWYSGNPNLYTSTVPQSYKGANGKLHRYPSVAEYSNSVLKKYRQYRTGEN